MIRARTRLLEKLTKDANVAQLVDQKKAIQQAQAKMNQTDQHWLDQVNEAFNKETILLRKKKKQTQNMLKDHYLNVM